MGRALLSQKNKRGKIKMNLPRLLFAEMKFYLCPELITLSK